MRKRVSRKKTMAAVIAVTAVTCASVDFTGLYMNEDSTVLADSINVNDIKYIAALSESDIDTEIDFNDLGKTMVSAGVSKNIGNSTAYAVNQADAEYLSRAASEAIAMQAELRVLGSTIGSSGVSYDDEDNKDIFDYDDLPEYFKEGVTHDAVMMLQQRLMDLGFMEYSEPTNYYGSITKSAVIFFQRQNGLTEDGIIGPETLNMIFSDEAKLYYMAKGMKGDDIVNLQTRLYELGYFASADMITGYFGDTTAEAYKHFQENNGLADDGMADQNDIELLYSESVKANILSFGDKSDVVLECQKILKKLGYMYTEPDGMYGSDTLNAVKQFQKNNGITADGYLGPTTLSVMHSDSPAASGLRIGDSGDSVLKLQELLYKYGYINKNSMTSYYGTTTEEAVKRFQKYNGLTSDGIAGSNTINFITKGKGIVKASDIKTSNNSSGGGSSVQSKPASTGSSSTASASKLVETAKSKVGCKYVFGAKGPDRFDCSGFVYWCLNQVGVKQSYITSYGWRSVGKYVKITNISNVKAGDIIVVYGHVGIAAGNGMVIDASSTNGKIVYRSINSWWKNNFICAWRIF